MTTLFNIELLSNDELAPTLVEVANPVFGISSSSYLVRRVVPRFEILDVLSKAVDGDKTLKALLAVKDVRSDIARMCNSKTGLVEVLTGIFGPSGLVEPNAPRYSAMDVMNVVSQTKAFTSYSTDAKLLYSGIVIHILDSFNVRQASVVTSKVIDRSGPLSPSIDDIIQNITESTVADKILHVLGSIRKTLDKENPKRRFSMLAYADLIASEIRKIGGHIANIEFREMWMRDIFKLVGRMVIGDRVGISTYGDLWSNPSLQALVSNSTITRLAVESLSDEGGDIVSLPAYEVNNVADEIGRLLGGLYDYEVAHYPEEVVQLSTFNRVRNCAVLSAVIVGVRRSVADTLMYTVIHNDDVVEGYVDVVNKSKELVGIRPHAPDDLFVHLVNDALAFEEDSLLLSHNTDYDVMAIGQLDIDDVLLGDVVATLCQVHFSDAGTRIFEVVDQERRLRAVNPAFLSSVTTTSIRMAAVATLPISDRILSKPRYQTEALVVNDRFSGIWDTSNRTHGVLMVPATSLHIVIKDLIHETKASFGTVEVPLFGTERMIPIFTEVSATEGWADIVRLINEISIQLNTSGSTKPRIQRAVWSTSLSTKLANWVMSNPAMRSLINRAISKIALDINKQGVGELFMRNSSLTFGEVALQCATGTLSAMSMLAGGDDLNEESLKLLYTPEVIMQFSQMVRPAGEMI